jgi:hypothetical protein
MVVNGDGEGPFGRLLADDVFLQEVEDLPGLGQFEAAKIGDFGKFLFDDFVAKLNALITDVDTGPGNELAHLLLALSAERALQQIRALANPSHM